MASLDGGPAPEFATLSQADIDVLQLMLAFEHLESAFYQQALDTFSADDFDDTSVRTSLWEDLQFVARDDSTHVRFWEYVLKVNKVTPVAAPSFSFPFNDVESFFELATIIEGVSTSRYIGAAFGLSASKGGQPYVLATTSLLATQAVHSSLFRSAAKKTASSAPFGTPLDSASVYTFIRQFVSASSPTDLSLPWPPYAPLTVVRTSTNGDEEPAVHEYEDKSTTHWSVHHFKSESKGHLPRQGDAVTVRADAIPPDCYITFAANIHIESISAAPQDGECDVRIPQKSMGLTYVFLTSADNTGKMLSEGILAGPAIIEVAPLPPEQLVVVDE